ncbi:MAG: YciI family protein [Terracoccus sp.]
MKTYLISLMSADGPPPDDIDISQMMADLELVNADIRAARGWVFAGGLADTASATTLRPGGRGREAVLTDGPFVEVKEHLGGISVVKSDDYDQVIGWARRIHGATGLPIEVRPFMGDGDPGMPATE